MNVCFVILHYLVLNETTECIRSILENVRGSKQIIVVDNGSPDGSGKELERLYKDEARVEVLLSENNLGFACGNNLGYEYAVRKYDPDFIVVMNNDMVIEQEDFTENIYSSYETWHFGIMGPDIYSTRIHGHQNPQSKKPPTLQWVQKKYRIYSLKYYLRGFMFLKDSMLDLLDRRKKADDCIVQDMDNYTDHVVENAFLHGSCYVFSRDFIRSHPTECLCGQTFMYMEAEILKYQSDRDGIITIYDPGCRVIHHEDSATDQKYSKRYQKAIFSIRNLRKSSKILMEMMQQDLNRKG